MLAGLLFAFADDHKFIHGTQDTSMSHTLKILMEECLLLPLWKLLPTALGMDPTSLKLSQNSTAGELTYTSHPGGLHFYVLCIYSQLRKQKFKFNGPKMNIYPRSLPTSLNKLYFTASAKDSHLKFTV